MRHASTTQIVTAGLAALLVAFAATYSYGNTPLAAVCEIRTARGQGSGTLIGVAGDRALVLTCRHVAEWVGNPVTLSWLWAGGVRLPGRVVAVADGDWWNADLALVVCQRPAHVAPVAVAAYSTRNGPWLSAGWRDKKLRIQPAETCRYENGVLAFDRAYVAGMSGGPVFDRRGTIVGVVVRSDEATWGHAVDGPRLQELVARYQER